MCILEDIELILSIIASIIAILSCRSFLHIYYSKKRYKREKMITDVNLLLKLLSSIDGEPKRNTEKIFFLSLQQINNDVNDLFLYSHLCRKNRLQKFLDWYSKFKLNIYDLKECDTYDFSQVLQRDDIVTNLQELQKFK